MSDNPEWTKKDFEDAKDAASLTDALLDAFPKTRGPQRRPKKVAVSIRLDAHIVDQYKATGRGWQTRLNEDLVTLNTASKIGGRVEVYRNAKTGHSNLRVKTKHGKLVKATRRVTPNKRA